MVTIAVILSFSLQVSGYIKKFNLLLFVFGFNLVATVSLIRFFKSLFNGPNKMKGF